MSFAEGFDIGYLRVFPERGEDVFLSVTPRMRLGPGIQRDGITPPRMTDPHTVRFVVGRGGTLLNRQAYPATTNAYVQRAGTRTLYEHVQKFHEEHGKDYRIIGVQSCGDLTMNPWHVALTWEDGQPVLYHLGTKGDPPDIQEPWHERTYPCLVKWKPGRKREHLYTFLDLRRDYVGNRVEARVASQGCDECEVEVPKEDFITDDIEFALSGKVIVHHGRDVSLSSAIDHFQDVRHVFNVPKVPVRDRQGQQQGTINFGEYVLFHDLNVRRAALTSPIIVDLQIPTQNLVVHFKDLAEILRGKYHYEKSREPPIRRGEFRLYSEKSVEIFYRHNVYPFGVVGGGPGGLVCLASGGLSGRVGNTLEGIMHIMFDFFGCKDALVLDEGYDTFHILNPNSKKKPEYPDNYRYDNDDVLRQVAAFTLWRAQLDRIECEEAEGAKKQADRYKLGPNPWEWPLNREVIKIVEDYCTEHRIDPQPASALDAIAVEPRRSQMRSVLIFAVRREAEPKPTAKEASNKPMG